VEVLLVPSQRKLGGVLVLAGSLLLGVYVVPTVYGAAMSHLAVAQFRAQSAANREWDSSRIRAYQRSLSVRFAPPEAILTIPHVGLEGVDDLTLNRAAGHVPGTAMPGEPGNMAIAGHRDGFFRVLKDVVPGDVIEVQRPTLSAASSQTDRYVVRSIRIVSKSDASVLGKSEDNILTLVTCYPFRFVGAAPQRYIVQASLVQPAVQPASQPIPGD
jgi:sortase A